MSLSRALSCAASVAVCMMVASMVTPLSAQVAPYPYPPGGYQTYQPYQPTGFPSHQPNGYPAYQVPPSAYASPVYPTANANYQLPHVARISPEQAVPPMPAVPSTVPSVAPMQAPYSEAPGPAAAETGCATGGCANGGCGACGSCNLGGGFGTLFEMSGGCNYLGRSLGGPRGGCSCGAGCGYSSFGARNCPRWFGGIYGLYMDHDQENNVLLAWDGVDPASPILTSRDANPGWQPGNEIRIGRTFVHGNLACEFVFWGLYGEHGGRTIYADDLTDPGAALTTLLDFDGLEYDNGSGAAPVNDYYTDAQQLRASKYFEVQNFELNVLRFPLATYVGPCGVSCGGGGAAAGYGGYHFGGMYGAAAPCGCGPRLSLVGLAGVRYMRTYEWFDVDTDATDITFGNSADELFYDTEVKNHLVGFQLGCAANWQATRRFSLYGDGKLGIYNNHIQMRSFIYGSGGFAQVAAGLPYAGQNFDVSSTEDDVAFLGELRLGGVYALRSNTFGQPTWRLFGGYRAVAITGIALPTNQIPADFTDVASVSDIKSNGSMILHGLQAGVEVAY